MLQGGTAPVRFADARRREYDPSVIHIDRLKGASIMPIVRAAVTVTIAAAAVLALAWPASAGAEEQIPEWKSLKRDAKRAKVDEMAQQTLDELFAKSIKAEALYEKAYGWAVFDNYKLAFMFSGGAGNGVAVDRETGERTYMKMGTVGVGLGVGGQKYQVVFLFQDKGTFVNFVEHGWQADAGATAAAGTEGVNTATGFINGLALFKLTDAGLMAAADIAGTKYWKNKKLNRGR
jgi:lipid-binding SYLF domain-containing protein